MVALKPWQPLWPYEQPQGLGLLRVPPEVFGAWGCPALDLRGSGLPTWGPCSLEVPRLWFLELGGASPGIFGAWGYPSWNFWGLGENRLGSLGLGGHNLGVFGVWRSQALRVEDHILITWRAY